MSTNGVRLHGLLRVEGANDKAEARGVVFGKELFNLWRYLGDHSQEFYESEAIVENNP